jgi:flagellar secretion chaperone FliS
MMLFDGGLRFAEQARVALAAKKYDESYEAMSRLQKIVLELRLSLKNDVDAALTDKLTAIYTYIYNKLVEANVHRNPTALEEATRLFKYQRDTWALLLDQLAKTKAAQAASSLDIPEPNERMEASICMQG